MKQIIALLLAATLALPAHALPAHAQRADAIANMKSWCNCVMQGGVCQVENNPKVYRPGQQVVSQFEV